MENFIRLLKIKASKRRRKISRKEEMRMHRLWALLCVGLWGCSQETSTPHEEPLPQEAVTTQEAVEGLPLDFASVVDQIHFAYRPDPDGSLRTIHATFDARVTPQNKLLMTPQLELASLDPEVAAQIHDPDQDGRVASAPVEVETTQIALGSEIIAELAEGQPQALRDGRAAIQRGPAQEQFRNRADGVEQQWLFRERPEGDGDLTVRVRVSGLPYAGETEHGHQFLDSQTGLGVRYGLATWVDALGRETAVPVKREGEELVLTVSEEALAWSSFPAVLDPVLTPVVGVDHPVVVPPSYVDGGGDHAVACEASVCLVAWRDTRGKWTDGNYIYTARVTRAGVVLDPGGVPLASSGNVGSPNVAWDPASNNFLVAWPNGTSNVHIVTLNREGYVYGKTSSPALTWNAYDEEAAILHPNLACGGAGCLLTYYKYFLYYPDAIQIYAHPVSVASNDVAVIGTANPVWSGFTWYGEGLADRNYAPLALAATKDYFVLSWTGFGLRGNSGDAHPNDNKIFTTVLRPNATSPFNAPKYALTGGNNTTLKPALDCALDQCLIATSGPTFASVFLFDVFQETFNALGTDSWNTSIDAPQVQIKFHENAYTLAYWHTDGLKLVRYDRYISPIQTTTTPLLGFGKPMRLSVAGDDLLLTGFEIDNNSIYIGEDPFTSTRSIYGTRISPTLQMRPRFPISVPVGNNQITPAVTFAGGTYLLTWADDRGGITSDIWAARIQPNGLLLDPQGIEVATGPGHKANPSVACGLFCTIAWEAEINGSTDVLSRSLDLPTGYLTGSILNLAWTATPYEGADEQRNPTVMIHGTNVLVAWEDWGLSGGQNADLVMVAMTDSADTDDDNGFFVIAQGPGDQTDLSFDNQGDKFLAAWTDWGQGPDYAPDIMARTFSQTTVTPTFTFGPIFPVALYPSAQQNPQVVYDGNGTVGSFLVVWEDDADIDFFDRDLRGIQVTQAGSLVQTNPVGLISGEGDDTSAQLLMDGTRMLMVYTRQTGANGEPRIWAARFNRAGLTQSTAPFQVTGVGASEGPETAPAVAMSAPGKYLAVFQRYAPLWRRDRVKATFFSP
jgi:hypothetical protein